VKDEARIIWNTLIAYAAKLISGAVGFLMVPYLVRSLGESVYGVWGICWSILGLFLLVEMGVRPGLTRQFTDALFRGEVVRSNQIASSALAFYFAIAVLIVGALALSGSHLLGSMKVPPGLESEAYWTLVLVGCAAGVGLIGVPYNTVLQSLLRHDFQNYAAAGKSVVSAAAIVAVFELWKPRIVVWAIVEVSCCVLILALYVWQSYRQCPSLEIGPRLVSRRGFGEITSFGMYTTLLSATGWINMQSGPMVISYFLGTAAVAHFTPVLAIVATVMPLNEAFLAPLRTFLTRMHASDDWDVIRRVMIRSTRYSLLLTGGIVVLIGATSSAMVPLWLGRGFEDTSRVLTVWCAAYLTQASAGAAYGLYLGTGRLRMITILNVVLALLSLAIGIALVRWSSWGVVSVAWGMLAAYSLRAVAFFLYSTYLCELGRGRYLREAFAGPALCLAVLGGTALAVQHLVSGPLLVELGLAVGVSVLVYAPLAWRVGLAEADRTKALDYLASAVSWRPARGGRPGANSAD
jgi:O-antigen/teichoic acid export membrane protein